MKRQFLIAFLCAFCTFDSNAQIKIPGTVTGTAADGTNAGIPANTIILGNGFTTGSSCVFLGQNAGTAALNSGNANTFVGQSVGILNTSGWANAFFGAWTGTSNTTGTANTFLGQYCGISNTQGGGNVFIGQGCATNSTIGWENTIVGTGAAGTNTTGYLNTFLGRNAGIGNVTGNNNSTLGAGTGFATGNLTNATAIGANTISAASNSIILGPDVNTTTSMNVVKVGIGTDNPIAQLHVENDDPGEVLFSTTNSGVSSVSTLKLNAPGPLSSMWNLKLVKYSNTNAGTMLGASGTAAAIPWANMSGLLTEGGGLAIGRDAYSERIGSIHFMNYVNDVSANQQYAECMRINHTTGFVGIHTRQDNVTPGTGDPTALLHVNLTNPINSNLDPLTQGIRFQGLPTAQHDDVIVIDADGNLAKRPYGGSPGGNAWELTGNTVTAADFIGTLNNADFRIYTNNSQRARFTGDGNFELGSNVTLPGTTTSAAIGTGNTLDVSTSALISGTRNTIRNSSHSTAFGDGNIIEATSVASQATGKDNTLTGATYSIAIGDQNVITQSTSVLAGGTGTHISNSYQTLAFGDGSTVNNSYASGAIGEENEMYNAHGNFIGGGHNYSDGAYNFIGGSNNVSDGFNNFTGGNYNEAVAGFNTLLGNRLVADVASSTPVSPDPNDNSPYVVVIGERINSNLTRSLSTGFNGNRTTVTTEIGMAVQLNPTSGTTYAPTVNFEVDAAIAPSPGPQPLAGPAVSNIRFHNLPPDPQGRMLPAVLIDPATGELFQSQNTYLKPGKGDSGADLDSLYKENDALKNRVAELESKLAVVPELQSQLAMYDEKFTQLERSLNRICESGCAGLDNKHSDVLYQSIPNPTDNNAKINYFLARNYSEASIILYSMDGREVGTYTLNPVKGDGSVDVTLGDVSPGTYLYRLIVDGNPVAVKKIQKQ